MRQTDATHTQNAVIAANFVTSLRDERRRSAVQAMQSLAAEIDGSSVEHAALDVFAPMLAKAGASVDRFEDARRRHMAALHTAAAATLAAAIEQSGPDKARLDAAIASRGKALDAVAGSDAPRILLDVPFSIIPTSGLAHTSSTEQRAGSTARFTLHSSRANGYEEVAFHFIWGNTGTTVKVIDVDAYLVLHGHVRVGSDGGLLPGVLSGDRYSQLELHARVAISLWGAQPTTTPMEQADQNLVALVLNSDTGGWGSVGAIEVADVFRGFDLRHTLLLVPPHTNVVFQVLATVSYSNSNGNVDLDFASGGFEVVCPGVLLTVRS